MGRAPGCSGWPAGGGRRAAGGGRGRGPGARCEGELEARGCRAVRWWLGGFRRGRTALASKHGGWASGTSGRCAAHCITYADVNRDTNTLHILLRGARGGGQVRSPPVAAAGQGAARGRGGRGPPPAPVSTPRSSLIERRVPLQNKAKLVAVPCQAAGWVRGGAVGVAQRSAPSPNANEARRVSRQRGSTHRRQSRRPQTAP